MNYDFILALTSKDYLLYTTNTRIKIYKYDHEYTN